MTDDERFEQFVRDHAADYRAPEGDVPADAMWEAIRARRAGARPAAAVPATPAPATPRIVRRTPLWIGMAATLLLGVAVGRFAFRSNAVPAGNSNGSDTARAIAGRTSEPTTTTPSADAPSTAPVAIDRRPTTGASKSVGAAPRVDGFTVASAQHLQAVQTLLTSFAASGGEAKTDSALAVWAQRLLADTRLLLDSPAARDPQRARLLQDLEVILVQLVQRSPGGDAESRDAVERTLQKQNLMPRLRSAVPASLSSGTD